MFVAIVTAPRCPAMDTISASFWWYLAFSTLCGTPRILRKRDSSSLTSTEIVPTSTGWPRWWQSAISSITALYFSRFVR